MAGCSSRSRASLRAAGSTSGGPGGRFGRRRSSADRRVTSIPACPTMSGRWRVAEPRWSAASRAERSSNVVSTGTVVSEAAWRVRSFSRRAIARSVGRWSPRSAAIVTAIVIGDRAGLDDELQRRLQEAGTYHVIAISGGNIAILAGLTLAAFRMAGLLGPAAMLGGNRQPDRLRVRRGGRRVGGAGDADGGRLLQRPRHRPARSSREHARRRGSASRRRAAARHRRSGLSPHLRRDRRDRRRP